MEGEISARITAAVLHVCKSEAFSHGKVVVGRGGGEFGTGFPTRATNASMQCMGSMLKLLFMRSQIIIETDLRSAS